MSPQKPKPKARVVRARDAPKRRRCAFCTMKENYIDYKNPFRLQRYISDRGRIEPRRRTGTCPKHQRALAQAIKRARHLALLPYTSAHIRKTGGLGLQGEGGGTPIEGESIPLKPHRSYYNIL